MVGRFLIRWLTWGIGCLLVAGLLGVAAFFGGYALLSHVVHKPEVIVPPVHGMPEAEAIKTLVSHGLAIHFPIERQQSDQYEEGLVIEQSPRPNIKVREGRKIRITVSEGARLVMIPDLVGSDETSVYPVLNHLGLDVGERAVLYDDRVEPGIIIAQNPPTGEVLHFGKFVSILVSLGPRPEVYVMPNKIGSPSAAAVREFEEMGFSVVLDRQQVASPEDWDRVIDQDPPSGSKLPEGSEITFKVGAREIEPERPQWIEFRYVIPDDVTSRSVTVAVTDLRENKEGEPQIVRVPVPGPGQEIRVPLPFVGRMRVEVYDGAAESGTLLHSEVIDSPASMSETGQGPVNESVKEDQGWVIDGR